jgi:hypothetical protein
MSTKAGQSAKLHPFRSTNLQIYVDRSQRRNQNHEKRCNDRDSHDGPSDREKAACDGQGETMIRRLLPTNLLPALVNDVIRSMSIVETS